MKASLFSFIALLLWANNSLSQSVEFYPVDTLKYNFRTGGRIDTFDLTYANPYTTFPAIGFDNFEQLPSIDFLIASPSLFAFQKPSLLQKKTISALPHVGFFYSFGLKGTQALHADYQQSINTNLLLNLTIDRQSSGGFAVNSGFSQNLVRFGLYQNANKFSFSFKGSYSGRESSLYGGNVDSLSWKIDSFGLPFADVYKTNASSTQKGVNSELLLKYNALSDSSRIKIGPAVELGFNLLNRVYKEENQNLDLIYSQINIDSTETTDQFQDAKLSSGAGIFMENKKFNLLAFGTHRYWRFQNLGTNRDTAEYGLKIKFVFSHKNIAFKNESTQNIIGAQQEFFTNNEFRIGDKNKSLGLFANYADAMPELVQRFYFGNNINYGASSFTKQKRFNLGAQGKISFWKLETQAKAGIMNWTNNLIWQDTIWTISADSDIKAFYFHLKTHLDLGKLHWYPSFQYQTGSDYMPEFVFSGRILFKSKVFKAKKLELMFALDPQVNSFYKFLSYNTLLDNYAFDSNNRSGGQPYALHGTFGMGIEEFRFFVRAENLQSFWTAGNTEILQNYYRSPFVLRLGLSWDFFN